MQKHEYQLLWYIILCNVELVSIFSPGVFPIFSSEQLAK